MVSGSLNVFRLKALRHCEVIYRRSGAGPNYGAIVLLLERLDSGAMSFMPLKKISTAIDIGIGE